MKEIRVRDGDAVNEGDVLIRLDDGTVGANLRLLQDKSAELAIRMIGWLLSATEPLSLFYRRRSVPVLANLD